MIIGIAGGSCTGKTTLVHALTEKLGNQASLLSFDDYFIGTGNLVKEVTDWETPSLYRYHEFIRDLKVLKSGKSINVATKSRESTEAGISYKVIEPRKFTIIEGFLIFHDKTARELFDKRVYIQLDETEMIRRRLARSVGTSMWNSPDYIKTKLIPGHRRYVEPQKTYADLVVDGNRPTDNLANAIMDFFNQH